VALTHSILFVEGKKLGQAYRWHNYCSLRHFYKRLVRKKLMVRHSYGRLFLFSNDKWRIASTN